MSATLHAIKLRRDRLEVLQTARRERVCFTQDGVLHGQVSLPVFVLHVHEHGFDAADVLAQLEDIELHVDGVLPDLLEPVEEGGEEAGHQGDGCEDHACEGRCWNFGRETFQKVLK